MANLDAAQVAVKRRRVSWATPTEYRAEADEWVGGGHAPGIRAYGVREFYLIGRIPPKSPPKTGSRSS